MTTTPTYVFKNDVLVSIGWTYVSKTEFLNKSREAISAGGVKQDQDDHSW